MDGKGHLAMGTIFGVGVSLLTQHTIDIEMVSVSTVAATFCDFDTGSRVRNKLSGNPKKTKRNLMIGGLLGGVYSYMHGGFPSIGTIAGIIIFAIGALISETVAKKMVLSIVAGIIILAGLFYKMYWLAALGGFIAIAPHTGHRTWTHSIWATALMYFIFKGAEESGVHGALVAGLAGFVSHLIADAVTIDKVKFLYPVPFSFGITLMKSGQTLREWGIVAAFAVGMLATVYLHGDFNNLISNPVVMMITDKVKSY